MQKIKSIGFAAAISLLVLAAAGTAAGGDAGVSGISSAISGDLTNSVIQIRDTGIVDEKDAPVPIGIRIADLVVDAEVSPVGVDKQHRFEVPTAEKVGWYKHSSTPGEEGASVLAGHVDFAGERGVFFELRNLEVGEIFEIEMSDETLNKFEVIGNTSYDKIDLPADEVFRKTGSPVLHLITCGGSFDPDARSYNANVVVTAKPIV